MKILIFSTAYHPLIAGAEIAIKEITDRLPEHQFDLICAKIRRGLPAREKLGAVTIYRLGVGSKLDKFLLPLWGFLKAWRLGRRDPYDWFWVVMASYGSLAALFAERLLGVPIFLTLQEGDSEEDIYRRMGFLKPLFQQVFKKARQVQAISHYLAKWAKTMGAEVPASVVPNGVDLSRFKPRVKEASNELRSRLQLKPKDQVVITVSRLEPKNGVADLIQAMVYLSEEVKLFILGSGSLSKSLRQLAVELKISERVHFLGEVSQDALPSYLALAEVFCRPSLSEGLGIAFLEAMAMGVAIVATKVGGIPDFLEEGVTGLFCEVSNPESIAAAIKRLLDDSALRERIAANGRKLVREKYDWDLIAKEMNRLFLEFGTHNLQEFQVISSKL